jgi:hypothetical protein
MNNENFGKLFTRPDKTFQIYIDLDLRIVLS